jgi:similar to spore coat protein
MNFLLEKMTGMDTLTDQVIAYDFLTAAKTGVRNYAMALTETASPEVEKILRRQLEDAITLHGKIAGLLMDRGWYLPYEVPEQIKLDLANARTAIRLAD